ncbi:IS256 family transposase, partial [Lyngbya confervoides BDU141951]|nr:IS256 family transposase [Lyngbya confervoides BDU141951]
MPRKKQQPNRVDELLDQLLAEDYSPEAILGESGLLKQLTKRLVERALDGELNHHLQQDSSDSRKN